VISEDVWEADYQPILHSCPNLNSPAHRWLGLVVNHSSEFIIAIEIIHTPPTVNEMATLLATAMRSPIASQPQRPVQIHLRNKDEWTELVPHLNQLGIEVAMTADLPKWMKSAVGLLESMGAVGPGPLDQGGIRSVGREVN
jgi:hypothetical protein